MDLDIFSKSFEKFGFFLAERLISCQHADRLRALVLKMASVEREQGQDYLYPHDPNKRTQRVWNLTNKHQSFRDLLELDVIHNGLSIIFARPTDHPLFFLSSFQANALFPGASAQKLHVDTPFPEPLPPWAARANTIWFLDDFTEDNGATEVVPKSHKFTKKPSSRDQIEALTRKITGPKGSVLFTHGNLWHRAGQNKSQLPRVAMLACFAASYMKEIASEEDQSLVVSQQIKDQASPRLKSILGIGHGIKTGAFFQHDT